MGSKFYPLRATIGESNGTPLQYSCLENPMDGGAWWAAVHGVAKSRAWLSDFTFALHFHALEKEIATHSSVLAWRIPETEEPGGLPSMGSHRVGHDWSDLAAAACYSIPLRLHDFSYYLFTDSYICSAYLLSSWFKHPNECFNLYYISNPTCPNLNVIAFSTQFSKS